MSNTLLKKAKRMLDDRYNEMGARSSSGERITLVHVMSKAMDHEHIGKTDEESITYLVETIDELLESYKDSPRNGRDRELLRELRAPIVALLEKEAPQEVVHQEG